MCAANVRSRILRSIESETVPTTACWVRTTRTPHIWGAGHLSRTGRCAFPLSARRIFGGWGGSMGRSCALQLLLPPLLLLPFLWHSASGQFIVYNGAQQLIYGPKSLQQALADSTVTTIVLSGNVTLNSTNWSTPPTLTNRSVLFVGDESSPTVNALDFGGVQSALVVGDGGEVEFRNVTLSRPGPQNVGNSTTNFVNFRSQSVGAWPSLIVLDGSKVIFNNSRLFYYSQLQWSRCGNFAAKIKFQLTEGLHYTGISVSPTNNASLLLSDTLDLMSNITDINTNKTAGEVELVTYNTTMTCVNDPFAQDTDIAGSSQDNSGGGFKWWYGLIIAIGSVLFVAALAAISLAVFVRRRRKLRRQSSLDSSHPDKVRAVPSCLMATGSLSHSEEQKPASFRPSSSVAATQLSAELDGKPTGISQVGNIYWGLQAQLDAMGSAGMASESGKSQFSESGREVEHAHSGGLASSTGKGSGGLSESGGLSWSDVTALLRARSDFSDIEVGPLIGRGSFGRVYKGRWKGAFVAIKIVDHQEAASKVIAMREGTLSHSVQHPNVITTYSVFLQRMMNPNAGRDKEEWAEDRSPPEDAMEGIPERTAPSFTEEQEHFATCMVLEYADRGTLEKAVQSGKFHHRVSGEPDLKAIHRTLLDLAGGMDYLHSVGVLHGDLKGANVLLKSTAMDPRGFQCKLADFGMARILDTNRTHVSTQTYGTISYMPAELLKEGKLTRAVDSYSFAILLWELFSGTMLHSGLTMAQVFYKICYEQFKPPTPAHMPEEYEELMVKCWDEDPQKRPTFSEIYDYLKGLTAGKGGPRGSLSTSLASPSGKISDVSGSVTESQAAAVGAAGEDAQSPSPTPSPTPAQTGPPPNPFAAASLKTRQPVAPEPSADNIDTVES